MTAPFYILALLILCLSSSASAEELVINAVGDVMLAGRWAPSLRTSGYETPFKALAPELKRGDITLANLESPIARGGKEFTGKKFRFRAEPEVAVALKAAGINLVTLANNHSMDFGGEALAETLGYLDQAGVGHFGAGINSVEARKAAIYTIKAKRVAFLGYSLTQPPQFFAGRTRPGTAAGLESHFVDDIRRARQVADYVIVSFHWGTEGKNDIQPYQRIAAHKAIDAGADVIIGHHPHVLRGIEHYKSGLVFYSLGNFAFASRSRISDAGIIVRLRFSEGKREAELLPLDILHRRVGFQPRPVFGQEAARIIERLNVLSEPLRTRVVERDGRYVVKF